MVFDHSTISQMDEMAVSKFKATCLAALERVRRTGRPLRVTRFGTPVADIVPPAPSRAKSGTLGVMRGRGRVAGDLTAPLDDVEWDGPQ
jgi:antitoxin (DNA-binding transcriptional repressor) of toxin-antitoxin stability system